MLFSFPMPIIREQTDQGTYVDLERLPDGNLKISLTDWGRQEFEVFEQLRDTHGIHAAILELLADHLSNGWEEVRPEEIGALTSAVLLTEEADRDKHGSLTRIGRVYWNPQYAVMDEIEEMRLRSFSVMDGVCLNAETGRACVESGLFCIITSLF